MSEQNERLREAVAWVLNDARYKAPEQIGFVAERWIQRLRTAYDAAGQAVPATATFSEEQVLEKVARWLEVNHRDDDDEQWEACCNLPDKIRALRQAAPVSSPCTCNDAKNEDGCPIHGTFYATMSRPAAPDAPTAGKSGRPRVVCLCGSTRFYEAFMQANYEETMAGRIVLSVGFFMHRPDTAHGQSLGCTDEQKIALDELHKRKIDLADEIFVLNVGGYIGSSTRSEIDYAIAHNKPVRYLEATPARPSGASAGEEPRK